MVKKILFDGEIIIIRNEKSAYFLLGILENCLNFLFQLIAVRDFSFSINPQNLLFSCRFLAGQNSGFNRGFIFFFFDNVFCRNSFLLKELEDFLKREQRKEYNNDS